jgi:hypothetical protein
VISEDASLRGVVEVLAQLGVVVLGQFHCRRIAEGGGISGVDEPGRGTRAYLGKPFLVGAHGVGDEGAERGVGLGAVHRRTFVPLELARSLDISGKEAHPEAVVPGRRAERRGRCDHMEIGDMDDLQHRRHDDGSSRKRSRSMR